MLIFSKPKQNELSTILDIYNEVRGKGYCVWDDEYPTMDNINEDYELDHLFVLKKDEEIIGAISIDDETKDNDDAFKFSRPYLEISRVVIKKKYQGKGYSKILVQEFINHFKNDIYKSIRLYVEENHLPAINCYKSLGFIIRDKRFLYEHYYYLCEREI